MSTDQRKLSFKWHQVNGEIRRFTLSLSADTDVYAALIAQITAIDPTWKNDGSSQLYWIDSDNDHIHFNSTDELNEAIEIMKDRSTIAIYSSTMATIEENNGDEPIFIADYRSKSRNRHRSASSSSTTSTSSNDSKPKKLKKRERKLAKKYRKKMMKSCGKMGNRHRSLPASLRMHDHHRGWFSMPPHPMAAPPMMGPFGYHGFGPFFDDDRHHFKHSFGKRGGRGIGHHFGLRRGMGHHFGLFRHRGGCAM
jgi:hypothetical protein